MEFSDGPLRAGFFQGGGVTTRRSFFLLGEGGKACRVQMRGRQEKKEEEGVKRTFNLPLQGEEKGGKPQSRMPKKKGKKKKRPETPSLKSVSSSLFLGKEKGEKVKRNAIQNCQRSLEDPTKKPNTPLYSHREKENFSETPDSYQSIYEVKKGEKRGANLYVKT